MTLRTTTPSQLSLGLLFLLASGNALADTHSPVSPLTEPLELSTPWREDGRLQLELETETAPSAAPTVRLKACLHGGSWQSQWQAESDFLQGQSRLQASVQTALHGRLQAYGRWRGQEGQHHVEGGLQGSLLGSDQWRAAHRKQVTEEGATSSTETGWEWRLPHGARLEVGGLFEDQSTVLSSGFTYQPTSGFQLGATWKARRLHQVDHPWQEPTWEGRIRWAW